MSAPRRLLRIVLLLGLLGLAGVFWLFRRLEHPAAASNPQEVNIFVPFGSSTREIFRRLAAEGVVAPAWLAEAYYRVARSARPLQAGEYRFTRPTALSRVLDRMARGDVVKHPIVVPEGLTAEETFELFWSRGISRPEAFRKAFQDPQLVASLAPGAPDLEGFLFPDTYEVTRSTSARQIVESMVANFRRHFAPELRARAAAQDRTLRDAVTLASIVQKETRLLSEAPVIAGVYANRLRRGMRLQADPTVEYALKRDGKWTGTLYRSDYGYESTYNTYLNGGLPPGPINNPGLAALKAAVSPARTEFLYFVADNSGGHRFSRTFEEHLDAIAVSRRERAAGMTRETPEPQGPELPPLQEQPAGPSSR